MERFDQRKKEILEKQDKSFKGCWDLRIIRLCDKINSLDDYYTTSSCSGRVIILKDQILKEKGIFLYIFHDVIDFKKFFEEIKKFRKEDLKFKQDPFILHITCRNIEAAKNMLLFLG